MRPTDANEYSYYLYHSVIEIDSIKELFAQWEKEYKQAECNYEYSEYNFDNENEQAFLDAGHFYGC